MIQPPPGSGSATADEDVCRPRPVTGLTMPVTRSASGTSALTNVDLPTPDWPIITLIFPSRIACSPASCSAVSGRWVTWAATPSGA